MNFNNRAVKSNYTRAQHPHQSSSPSSSQAHKALVIKKFVELISLDVDLDRTRQLLLPHKNIVELPTQLGSLLSQVRRLDLSFNNLTDLAPLSSLTHLTNLNVSHNTKLISLSTLNCPQLLILTASHCNLSDIAGITKCSTTLRTLVINDNNISLSPTNTNTSVLTQGKTSKQDNSRENYKLAIAYSNYCAIASLQVVETIILSRNVELCKFANDVINDDNENTEKRQCQESNTEQTSKESLDSENKNNGVEGKSNKKHIHDANAASTKLHPLSVFAQLSQLRKLSLSQCNICSLPLHWYLPKLNELRLAHNSLESLNPDGVLLQSLKILDVAHNQFHSIATLRRCKYLQQLSLSGNSVYDIYAARDEGTNAKLLLESVQHTRNNAKEDASSTTVNSVNKEKKSTELGADKSRVPLTLQRALHKMFVNLTSVDGQALLPESVLSQLEVSVKHFRVKRTRNAVDEEDEEKNNNLEQSEHNKSKVEDESNDMHTWERSTTEKNNDLGDHFNVSVTDEEVSPLHNKSYELKHTCQESRCDDNQEEQKQQPVQEQNETEKADLTSISKSDAELIDKKLKHTCDNHKIAEAKENMDKTTSDHVEESDVVYTPSQTSLSANKTHAPIIKRSRVFTVDLGTVNRNITNNSNNHDDDDKDSTNKISKKSKFDKNKNKKLKGRGSNRSSSVIVTQGSDAVNALLQKKAMNDKW